jgi:hypothetical protein
VTGGRGGLRSRRSVRDCGFSSLRCASVSPRWANKLLDDYRMGGTPFRGSVVPMPFNEDGKLVFHEGDTMMMGCGIYPAHMERDERIKPLIADLAKPEWMNPREPWDIYLRWAMKIIGVSNTPLIADMWATQNYRMAEGMIICDSVDHGEKVVRKREGSISSHALLVHGCKDGSLTELVLGKGSTLSGTWTVEKPAVVIDHTSFLSAAKNAVDAQEENFWGDDDKQPAANESAEPQTVIPVTAPKPPVHTVTEAPESKPTKATITRAAIEKIMAGKKMRATDLAAKLKVEVADLIGTFPTNGYIVAPGGWVNSTIQITKD